MSKAPLKNFFSFIVDMPRRWRKDMILVRLLKNSALLLSGNVVSSVLALISFAITARVLGPQLFGVLTIIQTYTRLIDRFFNFQSWSALIKYGAHALQKKEWDDLKGLFKLGFVLDMTTAVLGTALACLGAGVLSGMQGWGEEQTHWTSLYCVVILFNVTGTPVAILRLFDRFDILTALDVLCAGVRLLLVTVAFFSRAGFMAYLLIWLFTDILAYVVLIPCACMELRRKGITGLFRQSLRGTFRKHRGILGFAFSTNLSTAIRTLSRELDIIIIGAVIGEAKAGLFKVAKQFASVFVRLTDPLFYTSYPELAKLWAASAYKEFQRLTLRSSLMAGSLGVLLWFFFLVLGKMILRLTVGESYVDVYFTMMVYMMVMVIAVGSLPLSPAMFAVGNHRVFLYAIGISTLLYLIALPGLLVNFEITGAAYAYFIFYLIYTVFMVYAFRRVLREHLRQSPSENDTVASL